MLSKDERNITYLYLPMLDNELRKNHFMQINGTGKDLGNENDQMIKLNYDPTK